MNRYVWWIVCALASAGVAVAETPARKTFLDYCKGQATPAEARVVELLRIEVGLTECAAAYAALQKRERIDLAMKDITTVAPLVGLDALVELNIAFNDIHDLAPMGTLRNLRTLNINSLRASSLDALRSLKLLEELFVISAVKDIDVVADLPQLRVLNIEYAQVTDLSPLSKATCHLASELDQRSRRPAWRSDQSVARARRGRAVDHREADAPHQWHWRLPV